MGQSINTGTHYNGKWYGSYCKASGRICKWSLPWQPINWAAVMKEAYVIYMSVKKSTFYITGHDITLRSDHLPVNKLISMLFMVLLGWFVGCTSCTLQTCYAWLVKGLYVCMVGIFIYRILCLSLRCDSWYTTML